MPLLRHFTFTLLMRTANMSQKIWKYKLGTEEITQISMSVTGYVHMCKFKADITIGK